MEKSKDKNSFVFFDYWCIYFCELPSAESGELIKAICNYRLYGKITELKPEIKAAFMMIKAAMDTNDIKYAEKCEKNRENVNKRYKAKNNTNVYERIPKDTNVYECIPNDNDNEYDNDNDNEYDNDNDFLRIKEEKKNISPDIIKKMNSVLANKSIYFNVSKKRINIKLFEDTYKALYPGDTKQDLLLCEIEAQKHNYKLEKEK